MSRVGTLDYMPPEVGTEGGGAPAGVVEQRRGCCGPCPSDASLPTPHTHVPRSCGCHTAAPPARAPPSWAAARAARRPPTAWLWTCGAAVCWPMSFCWGRRPLRLRASKGGVARLVQHWRALGACADGETVPPPTSHAVCPAPRAPHRRDATYTRILKLEPALPSHLSGAAAWRHAGGMHRVRRAAGQLAASLRKDSASSASLPTVQRALVCSCC